jgi:hypothetical protein
MRESTGRCRVVCHLATCDMGSAAHDLLADNDEITSLDI